MSISDKLITIAENQERVYEAGKKSQYDEFWDEFQSYGARKSYNYAFQAPHCWNDKTYNPKYPIVASYATNLFVSNPNITDTKVPIDLRGCTINNTFSYSGLVTIRELIVDETTRITSTPNGFNGLYNLVNIKFTGVWAAGNIPEFAYCRYLSRESIESIVNVLSTETSGFAVTLSGKAIGNAFTDDEWNTLIATKPNWTFSLYSN